MLKGRGRDPRVGAVQPPMHLSVRPQPQAQPGVRQATSPTHLATRTPVLPRAPLAKPEPDYEVVEFPSEQYVNAKLQPPPPPPPRPPTGHPAEAASCGLCGGGGARVRCAECGRRALCASCDDMYHRHPKRRHHQRQALSPNQIRDERPPLPPKGTPPVPPPRRHKMSGDRMSASPRPPSAEQRNSTPMVHTQTMPLNNRMTTQNVQQIPAHLQGKIPPATSGGHLGSMPYLPSGVHHGAPVTPAQSNTLGHLSSGWARPRGSLTGFNMPPNVPMAPETWEAPEAMVTQSWGRPLRRGASVLELGGGMGGHSGMGAMSSCGGCGQCPSGWRYGSCASLDHQAWPPAPAPAWPAPACCHPQMHPHAHLPPHMHAPYTPQPYRRADSRAASRVGSRAGSRAASPAMSVRSRASRRAKHRTPSPPPLPSSDADSESESENDRPPPKSSQFQQNSTSAATAPTPLPGAASVARAAWQCEHCTFVNEPGVRVCAVCCRTPTAAPRELPHDQPADTSRSTAGSPAVVETARAMERLEITDAPDRPPSRAKPEIRTQQSGASTKPVLKKERVSTGCGPSPPREENAKNHNNLLVTPTREQSVESTQTRHDMAVGASPPREVQSRVSVARSPPRQNTSVRASPYKEAVKTEPPARHSISVGPSPPRENNTRPSPVNIQKKSTGTSPPREQERVIESRASSRFRGNVSNTGTSPPPQSISTQTYEVPNAWERSRSRRRFRDDARRERSHSRHSLSSDTRESERSARTSGGGGGGSSGRWEWRETRDSSPAADWSGSERRPPPRLARRASHLDLRRDQRDARSTRDVRRRSSLYRSEAASPEPTRALSLEALASASGVNAAAASRGLELARLMAEAERLGFSAAEVQAALAQSPAAPLGWLRARWPSLCAGVRAAAARLAPHAPVTDADARAALARHRGAMWPAVTDCVDKYRRQKEAASEAGGGPERRHGGRVWGSPAGADDDAAPPRGLRAEDSSDEFDGPPPTAFPDDDWMYLPLDVNTKVRRESVPMDDWDVPPADFGYREVASDVALELSRLLVQAGVPATSDDLILNGLLSSGPLLPPPADARNFVKPNSVDLIQSENDFIDAYNALTRSTPLPSVDNGLDSAQAVPEKDPKRDKYDVIENNAHSNIENSTNINIINNNQVIDESQAIVNTTKDHTVAIRDETVQAYFNPPQEETTITYTNNKNTSEEEVVLSQSTNSQISESVSEEIETNIGLEQNSNNNIEEPASAVASFVEEKTNVNVEENFGLNQKPNQGHDKTSNLNDIVGNTQRLIQQMKDEINSDINYIDSRTASQSEGDTTDESDISSEHESSYSDTEEKETDDLSSNESETSGTESDAEHHNERRPTIIQRTSSEENDQFEEAMDHIEDQIEDFKHTNIEILDSIARSLQEEHTISIKVQEPVVVDDKNQDLNNNLFVEVNSFDEIYAELNSPKQEPIKQKAKSIAVKHNSPEVNLPAQIQPPKINVAKQLITLSYFEKVSPIKLMISENFHNALNAVIEDIEEDDFVDSSENNALVNEEKEKSYDSNLVNGQHTLVSDENISHSSEENDSLDSEDSDVTPNGNNILISNANETLAEMKQKSNNIIDITISNVNEDNEARQNILMDNLIKEITVDVQTNEQNINLKNMTDGNIEIEQMDEQIATESNTEQFIDMQNANNQDIIAANVIKQDTNITDIENDTERNLVGSSLQNIIAQPDEEKIVKQENNENNIINNVEKDTSDKGNNFENTNNINNKRHKSLSKSPPKTLTENNANKSPSTNKSNIPKLVKVVPNNKQKADKTSPKVIASKVPVRRASVKQYPAPAPPKAHFGNVQSGHVKQLQTRLFNNKFPKTVVNVPDVVDVKPSTSTMHKKKPAPPPPTSDQKRSSPTKASPPKEKKSSYFRESCRTEDEWTESEAEDGPPPAPRAAESEEPNRPPSPPPPVTVRRVSGQIIDLARVRLPEGSPERQARMLLAQGATETWEQARLAVELVARGAEAAAALLAALECSDLGAALAYLDQECELCAERLPEHEMVSMLRCTHRCCRECARLYFTVQITERSIADCVCPYCKEPDLETTPEDAWLEYFAHLDILLKTLLEADVHELFQRKLRDRTLALDPNFRWCMECSSGFFVHPKQKKIRCPECRSVSCAKCRKAWSVNHEGLSCEQYAAWLEDNDPERSLAAVQQHLRENGLECPRCHFKYSLSRGGCMHFTCTQCKYEFCYGCGKPFMMGARCGLSEYCARLGLHAHHPRNCLFYLRDKEPHDLQTLLQMNNVSYETEAPEGATNRCPIQLQRETPTGLVDGICGGETPPKHAGLCKNHYLEYLSRLVRGRGVDPLPLLDVEDLETLVRRAALRPPPRPYGTLDGLYKQALLAIVREKIPLD